MSLRTGDVVDDRYELLEPLGRGGMGAVFRAHDDRLERDVAIKVLDAAFSSDDEFLARFQREARAAASLSHPGIVNVFDRGEQDGAHYIVMEYIDGPSLGDVLRAEGSLDPDRVLALGAAVADALGAAHRLGLVHRDVKPSNVLITPDGTPKVTDFGIARSASDATLTTTDSVLGSVPYVAPEQVRGEPATPASDVYALGCLLYALLTGAPPFRAEAAVSVLHQHLTVAPRPPSVINPEVSADVDDLVLELLAKEPLRRPGDGTAAAALLRGPVDATGVMPVLPPDVLERTRRIGREDDRTAVLGTDRTRVMDAPELGGEDGEDGEEGGPLEDEPPLHWGRRLAVLALVVALLVGVAMFGNRLADDESTPQPTAPTEPTLEPGPDATPEPAEPEPSPEPTSDPGIDDIIDDIGDMLAGGRGSSMSTDAADELSEKLEKVAEEYAEQDWAEARSKTDELSRELDAREREGQVTPGHARQLRGAIAALGALLAGR